MNTPLLILRPVETKWKCPHCGRKMLARCKRNHLRAVTQVNGRNVCLGKKEHPGFEKNERSRTAHQCEGLPIHLPTPWRSQLRSKKSKHG